MQPLLVLCWCMVPLVPRKGVQIGKYTIRECPLHLCHPIVVQRVGDVQSPSQPPLGRETNTVQLHPHPHVLVELPNPRLEAVVVAGWESGDNVVAAREASMTELPLALQVLVGVEE